MTATTRAPQPAALEPDNAKNITADAGGEGVTTFVSPRVGHGVALIPEPAVRARILGWLKPRV